jgi:hypothetical protein
VRGEEVAGRARHRLHALREYSGCAERANDEHTHGNHDFDER